MTIIVRYKSDFFLNFAANTIIIANHGKTYN